MSPGLLFERSLRKSGRFSANQRVVVIGAPSVTTSWPTPLVPLGDAVQEAQRIASQFHSSTLLTYQDATLPAVKYSLLNADIFHFAGHSVSTPEKTGLLLANGGQPGTETPAVLDASWLSSINLLKLQLVVLSACSTGREDDDKAGPEGLVKLFLLAGVPHVVATRWNVDSGTTALLMQSFYDHLLQGDTPSLALRSAIAGIRHQAATAHPYYWAAFNAFGRS
jgi:CHAT domain-containing protein